MRARRSGADFFGLLAYRGVMNVQKVAPPVDCSAILPGYDFADAYAAPVGDGVDATEAARRAFAAPPRWVAGLIALRDRLIGPFGLKPAPSAGFPVILDLPGLVVMGFDDRHLDFRIVVTVAFGVATLTTIVRRRNLLGSAYLLAILPFHRLIARAYAARMA